MPEMTLVCGCEEFTCTSVSVKTYRRYTEIMERNEGESAQDAFEANLRILMDVFDVTSRTLREADVIELMAAAKSVHFVMQNIITQKFYDLNPEYEQVEQEKSVFDEYDEENGYNEAEDEAKNVWQACRESVDRIVKMCIRVMKNSYQQCMESDIMSLLDYVAFEIRTIKEN